MFRAAPAVAAVEAPAVEPCAHPVPLAELERDLGGVPPDGWALHLGKRGVVIVPDDLGRDSVSRGDARRIFDERREHEVRKARRLSVVEQEAIEADRLWRASLPKGLPVSAIPEGATYGDVVRQATLDAQPRRVSPLQEALGSGTLTYHTLPASSADES
jgi:hypothetical protein